MKKAIAWTLAMALCLSLLAGCGAKGEAPAADGDGKKTVGICMPTKEQTIWSIQGDRLAAAFETAGYGTLIEYAEDDSAKQVMQIENMITKGVNVLVIAAVDCAALTDACEKAKEAGILIIADDRLITNTEAVDYYVTFDLVRMGEIQGQYIADSLKLETEAGPFTLEIFSGSQDDTNAISFYNGAMNILQPYLDSGKLEVKSGQTGYAETAIQSWDSSKAQARMDNLLSGYYADSRLDAVLVAADCLTVGVVSSLESMGYGAADQPFPVITGQDAELAAVKNILAGKQSMTVFLDANLMTSILVPLVDDLLAGREVVPDTTYDNGKFEVPTKTYDPYLIDKDNVDYLVEVGFYTDAEVSG
ncbi:MAG: sugar ABC transporter substrate-binding protein [Oscillospiraceae bacterium]|nr:sugar ABC transporter substrate-binding protein [Oscillospiraceae bacterium]